MVPIQFHIAHKMEQLKTNRLVEDKVFYDRIIDQILVELGYLSEKYDNEVDELGHRKLWKEKINKIKAGEKLGPEPEVKEIMLDIAQKLGLSDVEWQYLLNSLFRPKKKRVEDN